MKDQDRIKQLEAELDAKRNQLKALHMTVCPNCDVLKTKLDAANKQLLELKLLDLVRNDELDAAKAENARLAAALHGVLSATPGFHRERAIIKASEAWMGGFTALRDLLGPEVELLTMLEQREHSRNGASHLWKLIDIQLTRLRALVERKA